MSESGLDRVAKLAAMLQLAFPQYAIAYAVRLAADALRDPERAANLARLCRDCHRVIVQRIETEQHARDRGCEPREDLTFLQARRASLLETWEALERAM